MKLNDFIREHMDSEKVTVDDLNDEDLIKFFESRVFSLFSSDRGEEYKQVDSLMYYIFEKLQFAIPARFKQVHKDLLELQSLQSHLEVLTALSAYRQGFLEALSLLGISGPTPDWKADSIACLTGSANRLESMKKEISPDSPIREAMSVMLQDIRQAILQVSMVKQ